MDSRLALHPWNGHQACECRYKDGTNCCKCSVTAQLIVIGHVCVCPRVCWAADGPRFASTWALEETSCLSIYLSVCLSVCLSSLKKIWENRVGNIAIGVPWFPSSLWEFFQFLHRQEIHDLIVFPTILDYSDWVWLLFCPSCIWTHFSLPSCVLCKDFPVHSALGLEVQCTKSLWSISLLFVFSAAFWVPVPQVYCRW